MKREIIMLLVSSIISFGLTLGLAYIVFRIIYGLLNIENNFFLLSMVVIVGASLNTAYEIGMTIHLMA